MLSIELKFEENCSIGSKGLVLPLGSSTYSDLPREFIDLERFFYARTVV